MAYPGLILANAALGEGVETHLFFTFWGFDMINKKTMGDLKFTDTMIKDGLWDAFNNYHMGIKLCWVIAV